MRSIIINFLNLLIFGNTGKYLSLPGTLEILGNIGKYLVILINTIQYWEIRDNICQYYLISTNVKKGKYLTTTGNICWTTLGIPKRYKYKNIGHYVSISPKENCNSCSRSYCTIFCYFVHHIRQYSMTIFFYIWQC